MLARERYNQLVTDRRQFLDKAVDCSELTLPYLIQHDTSSKPTHETLNIPWQSVGSKCVVGLAAKLMLYKFCKELEVASSNIEPKELTKWWQ